MLGGTDIVMRRFFVYLAGVQHWFDGIPWDGRVVTIDGEKYRVDYGRP